MIETDFRKELTQTRWTMLDPDCECDGLAKRRERDALVVGQRGQGESLTCVCLS
jgi:hypothetical protein